MLPDMRKREATMTECTARFIISNENHRQSAGIIFETEESRALRHRAIELAWKVLLGEQK